MADPVEPYDPTDPHQRIERARLRRSFFRQTDIFFVVLIAMIVFVPVAAWHKPWGLPFLGWMACVPVFLPALETITTRMLRLSRWVPQNKTLRAILAALLFFPVALLFGIKGAVVVVALLFTCYIIAVWLGDVQLIGEDE